MEYLQIRKFARENRKNPTRAEKTFWDNVRRKNLYGLKVNRQHVIPYRLSSKYTQYFIADFYCHQLKLIIELDGRVHKYQKAYDMKRDEILNVLGLRVLRFNNSEVLNNWDSIRSKIKVIIDEFSG